MYMYSICMPLYMNTGKFLSISVICVFLDIRHAKKLVEYFNPDTQAYEIKHIQDDGGEPETETPFPLCS